MIVWYECLVGGIDANMKAYIVGGEVNVAPQVTKWQYVIYREAKCKWRTQLPG